MAKGKARELISIQTATVMKADGRMVTKKVMESSIGKTVTAMKGNIRMM